MSNPGHERARRLIALAGPEALSASDHAWLSAHLSTCASCRAFGENAVEMIHGLRATPIAAERTLVSATQARVHRRALELERRQERLWLVGLSSAVVTLGALLSAVVLWRGFEWVGAQAELDPSVWRVGFLVFCVTPALVAGILLLARDASLADRAGS